MAASSVNLLLFLNPRFWWDFYDPSHCKIIVIQDLLDALIDWFLFILRLASCRLLQWCDRFVYLYIRDIFVPLRYYLRRIHKWILFFYFFCWRTLLILSLFDYDLVLDRAALFNEMSLLKNLLFTFLHDLAYSLGLHFVAACGKQSASACCLTWWGKILAFATNHINLNRLVYTR